MAVLFADSFDHYTTVADKGWSTNFNGAGLGITANGRFGSGLRVNNTQGRGLNRILPSSYSTIIVGLAFRFSASAGATFQILELWESLSNVMHICLRLNTAGQLVLARGSTALATGTSILSPNVFYFLEVKVNIHDSTGSFTVRLNGNNELTGSGVDTRNGGTSGVIDEIVIGDNSNLSPNASINVDWDDLYVCDTSGSAPTNDLLGDVRIEARLPSGNGNTSNLVGSDSNSTDNYLLVDEAAPNGDTDYVESSTVNDKDTYAYQDLTPTSGTVYAVQILPYAKKTDAGVRSIKSVARLSATEVDGPDKTLSTTYQYLPDIREAKPGGGAWSISDVNSAEFGVKVSA